MNIFRCLIIILCFVIPPLKEIEQFISESLFTAPILPEWFSWLDICVRGLLVIMMAKEMVQFGKFWQSLREAFRIAEQIEAVKRQAEAIKEQPLVPLKAISHVDGDITYLWD